MDKGEKGRKGVPRPNAGLVGCHYFPQAYSYLPSHNITAPWRHQVILFGDRGT